MDNVSSLPPLADVINALWLSVHPKVDYRRLFDEAEGHKEHTKAASPASWRTMQNCGLPTVASRPKS